MKKNTCYVAVTFTGPNRPRGSNEDEDTRIYANERGPEDVSNALDMADFPAEVREIDMAKPAAQRKRLKARNTALKQALKTLWVHVEAEVERFANAPGGNPELTRIVNSAPMIEARKLGR